MKEFRKTQDGLFICEECNENFKTKPRLCVHINKFHNKEKYHKKWLKEKGEGLCKICKNKTIFISISLGYKHCCSKNCSKLYNQIQTEKGCMRIYGVKSTLQIKEFRDKGKKTCKEKYGDENYHNSEKIKQTNLKKYGVENVFQSQEIINKCEQTHLQNLGVKNPFQSNEIKEKIKKTNLENLGVEYPMQSKEVQEKSKQTCLKIYGFEYPVQSEMVKEKSKQTCLKIYGVEYPMQNLEIFEKSFKTRILIKQYNDTNLTYQGSYELDFLEKYHNKLEIKKGPSIKYKFNGKNKVYHSDFYIPSKNLVVEIKNSHLVETYKKEMDAKIEGTIKENYNFIMIVDKNYDEFDKLIVSLTKN